MLQELRSLYEEIKLAVKNFQNNYIPVLEVIIMSYKEFLIKTLDEQLEKIEGKVDKIKQVTIDTKNRARDFFKKLLFTPEVAIKVSEARREYSRDEIALLEYLQYIRRWNKEYILGAVAERKVLGSSACFGRRYGILF